MQIQQEATSAAASLQRAEPIGVAAARAFAADPSIKPRTRIFEEFALTGRVGIVTGGVGGIGLETALCLCEAGARIYCLDLAPKPTQDFLDTQQFCRALGTVLEYISIDVTDQQAIWKVCEEIGTKEGRFDIAVCAAGILPPECDCLDAPAEPFERTNHVNVNGVFYSAQAAGRQMRRFGQGGSIVLIASMSGSVTNRGGKFAAYNISKSAVIQMARSMACELGPEQIRINSLSPGHIETPMTKVVLDKDPNLLKHWSSLNPMGRIGMIHELRGVMVWLLSDASTFCTGSDILVSGGHTAW